MLSLRIMAMTLVLLACLRAQSARASDDRTEWELGVHVGVGAFVGPGWDANRVGGTLVASGGPRPYEYVALKGLFMLQEFHLRAEEDNGRTGETYGFAFAPELYPLGQRFRFEPYAAPIAGFAYTRGRVEGPAADLRFASRAVVMGAAIGVIWSVKDAYGVGVSARTLRMFVDRACIRTSAGITSCEAMRDDATRIVAVELVFRLNLSRLWKNGADNITVARLPLPLGD